MKRSYIYLLALSLGIGLMCKSRYEKKYPEDPRETKAEPDERLKGRWQLRDYTFKGTSIITPLNSIYANKFNILDVIFEHSEYSSGSWVSTYHLLNKFMASASFVNDEIIRIGPNNIGFGCCDTIVNRWLISPFHYQTDFIGHWQVTKLFGNELNLVLHVDSGDYKMFWIKK